VVVELIQSGATDIISKPIVMSRLQQALEKIVNPTAVVAATVSTQKSILIVEDFTITAKLLESRLKSAGYRLLMARTAEIGIDLIKRQKPDMILLDLNLPGMNGVEFIRHLQRERIDVPFAVVSGSKESPKLKDLRQLGALKVFTKPVDNDSLLNLVQGFFSKTGGGRLDRASYQVMIAVSDSVAGDILAGVLEKERISQRVLTDGYQAIAELDLQPRLVVVDALLDNTLGSEIIRKARAVPAHPRIRVLALSEFLDDDMIAELTELGADAVLAKPVNTHLFVESVKSILTDATGGLTPQEFAETFLHELSTLPPLGTADYRQGIGRLGHNLAGTAGLLNELKLLDLGRQLEGTAATADLEALRLVIDDIKVQLARLSGPPDPDAALPKPENVESPE
jgi:DNA-binding response OmpR family regulator